MHCNIINTKKLKGKQYSKITRLKGMPQQTQANKHWEPTVACFIL